MMPFCRSSGGGVHIIARVLESVAIVVMFSGKPLGTVCREMQKLRECSKIFRYQSRIDCAM